MKDFVSIYYCQERAKKYNTLNFLSKFLFKVNFDYSIALSQYVLYSNFNIIKAVYKRIRCLFV